MDDYLFQADNSITDSSLSTEFSTLLDSVVAYGLSKNPEEKLEDFLNRIQRDTHEKEFKISIDTHLNSPLLSDDPYQYLLRPDNIKCFHHRQILQYIQDNLSAQSMVAPPSNPLVPIFKLLRGHKSGSIDVNYQDFIRTSLETALLVSDLAFRHWTHSEVVNPFNVDVTSFLPESTLYWGSRHLYWSNIIKRLSRDHTSQTSVTPIIPGLIVVGKYLITTLPGSCYFVTNINYLIAAADIFTMQFNVRLITSLQKFTTNFSIDPAIKTRDFLTLMENWFLKYGNSFYKVCKNLEPLIVGAILNVKDPDLNNPLYNTSVSEIKEVLSVSDVNNLTNFVNSLDKFQDGQLYLLSLPGLAKTFGNPTIDSIKGLNKLIELTRMDKCIDEEVVKRAQASFRRRFCREYFSKHGKFPNVYLQDGYKELIHPRILQIITSRVWMNEDEIPKLTYDDWLTFKFTKTVEFDYMMDIEKIMSDKAISPPLSQWAQDYCLCSFANSGQKRPVFKRNTTRLLMNILTRERDISTEEIFKLVEERRIPRDWMRIKLQDKELELNDGGRKFSSQTPDIRLWQTISEHNIGKGIMKYLNYQSMTIGELSTEQRVTSMAAVQSFDKPFDLYFLNMDIEKWNMSFRYQTCQSIAEDIDNLFGMSNNIIYSHEFFENCTFTYPSHIAPTYNKNGYPIDGPGCHIGQPGGCEGLRQKLWTIITASVIEDCANELQISVSILCQGDNQTLLAKIPKNQPEIMRNLTELISSRLSKIGLKLKDQETWISRHIVSYSKKYYIDGVSVEDYIKQSTRVSGNQNSDYNCIQNQIGTVSTGGESIAKSSNHPLPGYTLSLFHQTSLLREEFPNMDRYKISACLLTGPIFGGFPVSQFSNFCLRGTPDPVTDHMSRLKFIEIHNKKVYEECAKLLNVPFAPKERLPNIIKDPLSLNLKIAITPTVGLEILLKSFLRKLIKLPRFTRLYRLNPEEDRKKFLQGLVKGPKIYPVVLNSIYSSSPFGILDRLETRFDNSNSLIKLVSEELTYKQTMEVMDHFVNLHKKSISKRLATLVNENCDIMKIYKTNQCTCEMAQQLRDHSWGVPIMGVTMPSPVEQVVIIPWNRVSDEQEPWCITAKLSDAATKNPKAMFQTTGPFIPYLGSETREKVSVIKSSSGKVLSDHSFQALRKLYVWLSRGVGPNMIQTLKNIIVSRLPEMNPDDEEELLGVIFNSQDIEVFGGCWTHRMSCSTIAPGCFLNQRYNPASHIQYSTSGAIKIRRGANDRTLFFQNIMMHTTSFLSMAGHSYPVFYPAFGIVIHCPGCCMEIPDEEFDIDEPLTIGIRTSYTTAEIIAESELIQHELLTTTLDPNTALSYYLANRCKLEVDKYLRAHSSRESLHDLMVSRKPTFSYGKTEVSSCDLVEVLQYLLDIYPRLTHTLRNLFDLTSTSTDLLSKSSCWIPLLGLATSLIGTDRVRFLMAKLQLTNSIYNIGTSPHRVAWVLYNALQVLSQRSKYQSVPTIIHLSESTHVFDRRIRQIAIKHKWSSQSWTDLARSTDLILPIHVFTKPDLIEEVNGSVIVIPTLESCLFTWRQNPTYAEVPVLPIGYLPTITGSNTVMSRIEFSDQYTEYPSLIPKKDNGYNLGPIHHFYRLIGNVSTAASKEAEILHILDTMGIDLNDHQILYTADGAGSMMVYSMHKYQGSEFVFNTFLRDEDFPQGNPDMFLPCCVESDHHTLENRLIHLKKTTLGPTDIFSDEFMMVIRSLNCKFKLIHSDVETPGLENIGQLVTFITNFSNLLEHDGVMIIRYHISDAQLFFSTMSQACKYFWIIKPLTSSYDTSEVYMIIEKDSISSGNTRWLTNTSKESYLHMCHMIKTTNRMGKELINNNNKMLKPIIDNLPCMNKIMIDWRDLGIDGNLPLPPQLNKEMNSILAILPTLGYEISKRTVEDAPIREARNKGRTEMIKNYLSRLIIFRLLIDENRDDNFMPFCWRIMNKVVTMNLIFNSTNLTTKLTSDSTVTTSDIILFAHKGPIGDLLGERTKTLYRIFGSTRRSQLRGLYRFDGSVIKETTRIYSQSTGLDKTNVRERQAKFYEESMRRLNILF